MYIVLNPLRNSEQLVGLNTCKAISVGFEDTTYKRFVITFELRGNKFKDLCINFSSGWPRIYISDVYWKKTISKAINEETEISMNEKE